MANIDQKLRDFFADYEKRVNEALTGSTDIEATAAAFADCFVGANPNGVMCGKNDDAFRVSIDQGFAFYRDIGTQSMTIVSRATTSLDDHHWMVKIHWKAQYTKKDASEVAIEFDVIYLLQIITGQPKIFAYITGDEQKALRERGLMPD